jgi:hypothetical protein
MMLERCGEGMGRVMEYGRSWTAKRYSYSMLTYKHIVIHCYRGEPTKQKHGQVAINKDN